MQARAVDLYYQEAVCLVPEFDLVEYLNIFFPKRAHTLQTIARVNLELSNWLFNHLGERIA